VQSLLAPAARDRFYRRPEPSRQAVLKRGPFNAYLRTPELGERLRKSANSSASILRCRSA